MKCDMNCLNCIRTICIHDIEDAEEYINDAKRKHKAQYYQEHKAERLAKQKEYNRKHRTAEISHAFYIKHKEEINKKNKERYAMNREARKAQAREYYYAHKEEISARRKKKRGG